MRLHENLSAGFQVTGLVGCDTIGVFENMLKPLAVIFSVNSKRTVTFKYRGSILSDQHPLSLLSAHLLYTV